MGTVKTPPSEICPQEDIGRQLFGSGHFSRQSGRVKYRAFYRKGYSVLSVDRLHYGPPGFLKAVGERNAEERNLKFHGWAKLTAENASRDGRKVDADPLLEVNPFHALILLSSDTTNDIDRKEVAMELARLSRHVPPDWGPANSL